MIRRLPALAVLSALLAGCALPGSSPAPTPFPADYLPTVVALTGQAAFQTAQALTPIVLPTDTPEPTFTAVSSTPPPTLTFTPQPDIPLAQIQFLSPGPMSKIITPIRLQLLIVAGESEVIQIDLFGEDGRLLSRTIDRVNRHETGVYATYKVPFEIRAAAETALLQVSTKDDDGRMQSLNSLRLVLLSSGVTEETPAGNVIYERAVFFTPAKKMEAFHGDLEVEGQYWPFNDQLVFLELILPDRTTATLRVLNLTGTDTQEFSTTLPYRVSEPTMALLSLRQMDPVLDAPIYVYTQEIMLHP